MNLFQAPDNGAAFWSVDEPTAYVFRGCTAKRTPCIYNKNGVSWFIPLVAEGAR